MKESQKQLFKSFKISETINFQEICQLVSYKKLTKAYENKRQRKSPWKSFFSFDIIALFILNFIFVTYLLKFIHYYYTESDVLDLFAVFKNIYSYCAALWLKYNSFDDVTREECALPMPEFLNSITRPISNCSMCIGLNEIKSVDYISKEDFLNHHAYTAVPLLVKSAALNWSAINVFSFQFLKNLYLNKKNNEKKKCGKKCMKRKESKKSSFSDIWQVKTTGDSFNEEIEESGVDTCQFFGYKTKFKSLNQVFNMNSESLSLKSTSFKPWYIGW